MGAAFELPLDGNPSEDSKTVPQKDERLNLAGQKKSPKRSKKYVFSENKEESVNRPSVLAAADEPEDPLMKAARGSKSPRKSARKKEDNSKSFELDSSLRGLKRDTSDLVEIKNPSKMPQDIVLSTDSFNTLMGVVTEFRRGDEIRRHGLSVRSKMLFCGPPGCGKTLCAEVLATELKVPLVIARLDAIITSHLGETASNLNKIFEAIQKRPSVLFLDEFDALARARTDANEHNEIRRVVNSLLMMIDRFEDRSMLVAATNLENSLDRAVWRRFDEVVIFDLPSVPQIKKMLKISTRNYPADFDIAKQSAKLKGLSFASIERICVNAIKASILKNNDHVNERTFLTTLDHEIKRSKIEVK